MMSKTLKVGVGEEKCKISRMGLNLRDNQLKVNTYILFNMNLMVTTRQKTYNRYTYKKRRESKQNTKNSHQITREQ